MKTTKLLLAIALLTITSTFAQKSNFEKDVKMYTQVWDNIINKRQIEQINDTHFDKNVVLVTSPQNIVGIAGIKAYYQNFLTGFSDITFTVKNVFGQGDQLVKHWNFKGKHTGNFFGIPATGNKVDVEGVTLVKMKNEKILQEQDFMDNTVLMQQLGLTSNPENLGVIDGLYKAFSAGDIPSVLAGMDANIVWNEAESNKLAVGNPYIGPDAVLNGVFAKLPLDFDGFKLTNIVLHEMSNNQVLATLRYNATSKHNAKFVDVQAAHLWTLTDGKIIAFQQYADTEKLAEAEK
jgi:steroid delta-isomerase-like uncharacterized protein